VPLSTWDLASTRGLFTSLVLQTMKENSFATESVDEMCVKTSGLRKR
jgi:hypothetical protein